jgi:hypothetical protein
MQRMSPSRTQVAPKATSTPLPGSLLQRKCACGNHTVGGENKRLGLQTKLKVNEPGDIYEQEADRIADQVLATPAHPAINGTPRRIQRFARQPTRQTEAAPASVDQALASPGRPLEPELRHDMEQRFCYDFSRVRVHTDQRAAQSAAAVAAHAYTVGSDVVFGSGRYAPASRDGQRLLAHELTHVVQQQAGSGSGSALTIGDPDPAAEREADAWSECVSRTGNASSAGLARPSMRSSAGTVQRQPMGHKKGVAGFGNEPVSRSIRVTIVGHASPRWAGASSEKEADRLNKDLSNRRSQLVRNAVERYLRQWLGENIHIEFAQSSRPENERPRDIEVGSHAVGSQETLEQVGGNRESNEEYSRRVEVGIELFTSKTKEVGRSVPPRRIPAFTQFWYVTIKKLGISGIVIPGPAVGGAELIIKNSLSGKAMTFRAILYGGGDPVPSDTPDENVGRKEVSFVTDREMGFDDFDGEFVRISRADIQLGLGVSRYYLSFPNLGKDAFNYMGQEFGPGFPGGYIVSGTLNMIGQNPGDWFEADDSDTETFITQVEGRSSEGLVLTFPTQSDKLSTTQTQRLDEFIATWARRLSFGYGP